MSEQGAGSHVHADAVWAPDEIANRVHFLGTISSGHGVTISPALDPLPQMTHGRERVTSDQTSKSVRGKDRHYDVVPTQKVMSWAIHRARLDRLAHRPQQQPLVQQRWTLGSLALPLLDRSNAPTQC